MRKTWLSMAALMIAIMLVGAGNLLAQTTFTWDGGGGDGNFSTDANWAGDPDVSATFVAGDIFEFPNFDYAGNNQPVADEAYADISQMTFDTTTSAIDLTFGANLTMQTGGSIIVTGGANGVTFTAGAGGLLTNGTLTIDNDDAGGLTIAEDITGNGANLITFSGSQNITVSGIITDGAATPITINMDALADIVSFSGANTYSGITTVSGGTLSLADASAFGANTTATGMTLGAGTKLEVAVAIAAGDWDPGITLAGAATIDFTAAGTEIDTDIDNGGFLLTLTGTEPATLSTGVISGAGGLTVNMTALLDVITLSGVNTYTGITTLSSGKLVLSNASAFGANTTATGLTLGAFTELGVDTAIAAGDWDPGITLTGNATIAFTAAGTEIDTDIDNGGFLLNLVGSQPATLSTGVISGAGGLSINANIITLSGVNTYTGITTLTGGTLRLANASAFGANTTATGMTLGAGTELEVATAIAAADWDPGITLAGAATISFTAAGTEIDTDIDNGGNLLTLTGSEPVTLSTGVISGAGGLTVNMTALADIITLSGVNTYAGITTVTSGTLRLANASAYGTNTTATGMTLGAGSELEVATAIAAADWDPGITLAGAATIDITAAGSEIDTNVANGGNLLTVTGSENITFSGIISGGGGLTVNMTAPTDVVTLSGANTYTGNTTLSAGTTAFNGVATGASAVTASNAGTRVEGTGTIPGTLTMNTGTILAPGGTAVGTLTVTGNVTLNGESKYEVTCTGANPDLVIAGADFTATGSTPNVEIQAGYSTAGFVLPETILNVTGAYTALDESALPAGWDIDNAKVGNLIRITAVTAPSSAVPTMNEWGLIITLILIAGLAVTFMGKRQQGHGAHLA